MQRSGRKARGGGRRTMVAYHRRRPYSGGRYYRGRVHGFGYLGPQRVRTYHPYYYHNPYYYPRYNPYYCTNVVCGRSTLTGATDCVCV